MVIVMVLSATIYIVEVSFIGGGSCGTQRKPPSRRKSLTNFIS